MRFLVLLALTYATAEELGGPLTSADRLLSITLDKSFDGEEQLDFRVSMSILEETGVGFLAPVIDLKEHHSAGPFLTPCANVFDLPSLLGALREKEIPETIKLLLSGNGWNFDGFRARRTFSLTDLIACQALVEFFPSFLLSVCITLLDEQSVAHYAQGSLVTLTDGAINIEPLPPSACATTGLTPQNLSLSKPIVEERFWSMPTNIEVDKHSYTSNPDFWRRWYDDEPIPGKFNTTIWTEPLAHKPGENVMHNWTLFGRSQLPCQVLETEWSTTKCHLHRGTKTTILDHDPTPDEEETWENCTGIGSGTALQRPDGSKWHIENTTLFLANAHLSAFEFLDIGPNVAIKVALHGGHYRQSFAHPSVIEFRQARNLSESDFFFIPSTTGNYPTHSKPRHNILDCSSYRDVARFKRIGLGLPHWESYSGTNLVFGLIHRCKEVHLLGFSDTEYGHAPYGKDQPGGFYKANKGDFALLWLAHGCGKVTLHH